MNNFDIPVNVAIAFLENNEIKDFEKDSQMFNNLIFKGVNDDNIGKLLQAMIDSNLVAFITKLSFVGGGLTTLPAILNQFVALETLDLRKNKLRILPGFVHDMPKLKTVYVHENRFAEDAEPIITYDRDLELPNQDRKQAQEYEVIKAVRRY